MHVYIKETYKYLLSRFVWFTAVITDDVFKFTNLTDNFQNVEPFNKNNVNSVKYGNETITSLGAKF